MPPSYSAESLFRVDGLVAVITGGGSGIGKIIAHCLVVNGAKAVYILGRREDALVATKNSAVNPDVIRPIICDVTSKEALQAAADKVRSEEGYCDVLFANSGVITVNQEEMMAKFRQMSIKELQASLWEPSVEDVTETLRVNVTGLYFTAVAFLDLLDQGNRRAGAIPQKSQVIVTSSIAGFAREPRSGLIYGASKAAATQLSKQLATVLTPQKIRVNCIAPGLYPSEMTEGVTADKDPREEGSIDSAVVPLGRMGTEEDMAGAILYLTSAAGSYVDGNVLVTDGGRLSVTTSTY